MLRQKRGRPERVLLAVLVALSVSTGAHALDAPVLESPEPAACFLMPEVNKGLIVLRWSAVAEADKYCIEVDGPPEYDPMDETQYNGVFDKTIGSETNEFLWDNATLEGTYFWRIRAADADGLRGPWSETRSFTLFWDFPTPTPIFRYDLYPDGKMDYRDVLSFSDGTFHSRPEYGLSCDVNTDGTVNSEDVLLIMDKWSNTEHFPTPTPTPPFGAPRLTVPENGSSIRIPVGRDGVRLQWEPVLGAVRYNVFITCEDSKGFVFTDNRFTTGAETYYDNTRQGPLGIWSWKVRVVGAPGYYGAWSEERIYYLVDR